MRMVQWNIERGYKLPQIIEKLKQQDADVRTDTSAAHAWEQREVAQGSCTLELVSELTLVLAMLVVLSACTFSLRCSCDR